MVKELIKRKHINSIIGDLTQLRQAKLTVTQAIYLDKALRKLNIIKDELPI